MPRTDHVTPRLFGLAPRGGPAPSGGAWGTLAVGSLLFACVTVVFLAGGPDGPAVHLLYLPVLLAALRFGILGGVLSGAAAGLAVGPWMALVGLPAGDQAPLDWGIRLAALVVVGLLAGAIRSMVRHRFKEEERLVTALTETHAKTLSTFASTIELRDPYTGGHSNRVARNARAVALALDLDEGGMRWAYWAGLLHDLGKVAVPERILLKPGPLEPEEMEVMRRHSRIGARLLEAVSSDFRPIAEGVKAHHERWDGAGYPDGVSGLAIPLVGRILGVVDVFEALTCTRPYRGAADPEEALEYVRAQSGRQFDPRIVEVFEGLFWRGEVTTASNPGHEVLEDTIRLPADDHLDRPVVVRDLIAPDPLIHLARG